MKCKREGMEERRLSVDEGRVGMDERMRDCRKEKAAINKETKN